MDLQLQTLVNLSQISSANVEAIHVEIDPEIFGHTDIEVCLLQIYPNRLMVVVDCGDGIQSERLRQATYQEFIFQLSKLANLELGKETETDKKRKALVDDLIAPSSIISP